MNQLLNLSKIEENIEKRNIEFIYDTIFKIMKHYNTFEYDNYIYYRIAQNGLIEDVLNFFDKKKSKGNKLTFLTDIIIMSEIMEIDINVEDMYQKHSSKLNTLLLSNYIIYNYLSSIDDLVKKIDNYKYKNSSRIPNVLMKQFDNIYYNNLVKNFDKVINNYINRILKIDYDTFPVNCKILEHTFASKFINKVSLDNFKQLVEVTFLNTNINSVNNTFTPDKIAILYNYGIKTSIEHLSEEDIKKTIEYIKNSFNKNLFYNISDYKKFNLLKNIKNHPLNKFISTQEVTISNSIF